MKTLIVYASKTGTTEKCAGRERQWLPQTLHSLHVDVLRPIRQKTDELPVLLRAEPIPPAAKHGQIQSEPQRPGTGRACLPRLADLQMDQPLLYDLRLRFPHPAGPANGCCAAADHHSAPCYRLRAAPQEFHEQCQDARAPAED